MIGNAKNVFMKIVHALKNEKPLENTVLFIDNKEVLGI